MEGKHERQVERELAKDVKLTLSQRREANDIAESMTTDPEGFAFELVSAREQLATLRAELEEVRKPAPHGNPNIPEVCNSCGRPLLLANLYVDDGCPCNSPRGVNFTPKPCELCGLDCCVKPGHRLKELFGFSDERQSDLERSAEIRALKEETATLRTENERLKQSYGDLRFQIAELVFGKGWGGGKTFDEIVAATGRVVKRAESAERENERLKRERDALDLSRQIKAEEALDNQHRYEAAERERDGARELVERWKYVERTWTGRNTSLERLVAALKAALVKCAIPLESIRASVKWELCDEIKQAVIEATDAARALLGKEG